MIYKHYLEELNIGSHYIKLGSKGLDVKRVQEWISLWTFIKPEFKLSVARDGDFGQETLHAVKEYQKMKGLDVDGIVGNITWRALTEPMLKAFSRIDKTSLHDYIIGYAQAHLDSCAREFIPNQGPWVRAYMYGYEGSDYPWCMGFVQTILDQAFSSMGKNFTDYVPSTLGCDKLGDDGIAKGNLLKLEKIDNPKDQIHPGDVFLLREKKNPNKWAHTGFVFSINDFLIETIEGNTNEAGSSEGVMVRKRTRDLKKEKIDIYKIME